MATLYFQQIIDSRRKGDSKSLLIRRINAIKKKLERLPDVTVRVSTPRRVVFGPPEPSIQWRADFQVKKDSRKVTWNEIYRAVNSVKAVPYSFR